MRARFVAGLCVLSLAATSSAEEALEEHVARDLLTVVTMEGLPCGEVVSGVQNSDEDYTVTCQSGDRYGVQILEGRVRVERATAPAR